MDALRNFLARYAAAFRRVAFGLDLHSENVWAGHRNDLYVAHLSIYTFFARFCRGLRVLDAGCGTGYGSAYLARAGAASVLGVDINAKSLNYARKTYRLDSLTFELGDLQHLQLPESTFDLIVSSNTLEHLEDPEQLLTRMHRWLAPTGQVIVVIPPIIDELSLEDNRKNPFHRSNFYVHDWIALFERLGWAARVHRHLYSRGNDKLDFSSYSRSTISEDDFDFPESTIRELYEKPSLGAVFMLTPRSAPAEAVRYSSPQES